MNVKRTDLSETKVKLTVSAKEEHLADFKKSVLARLGKDVKVQGFREGKAPEHMVEKHVNPIELQNAFIDEALNELYASVAKGEKLRPVSRPQVNITKFVPFTTLEFEAEVEILGTVKLPDYKKIKVAKQEAKVSEKDVTDVLKSLQTRMAEKKDVERAAKNKDEAWIDFKGVDEKGEPVKGADGKDYPLLLGSKTFIPGFEENIVGMKPGQEKDFTLTFPKDYGVSALANKKVKFTVKLNKVQEVIEPKLDDEFAKKAGPFKNLKQLKSDIKEQLLIEKQREADAGTQNEIIKQIVEKAKLNIPEGLINEQAEILLNDLKQNLAYRGMTLEDYFKNEGKTEEEYTKTELKPEAERRVKTGLVLAEIASEEKLEVLESEIDQKIEMLKMQYQDPSMRGELEKPEAKREIGSKILTEKTLAVLTETCTK